MAGGGSLGGAEKVKRGKQSKRKKKKRIGFHLDMTPLVDITFLLLTFFMFTTTMLKPQIMEMHIPPEIYQKVEVKASELLTIDLLDDGKVLWFVGVPDPNNKPEEIAINKIAPLAVDQNLKPNMKYNKLITLLKVSPLAKYDNVIKILDQLNMAEGQIIINLSKETETTPDGKVIPVDRKRKFTIAPLTEDDLKELQKAGGF